MNPPCASRRPSSTPPAKAITESTSKAEPVRIKNAPSFTAADVSTSLAAASAAEAGLITGNLQDGNEVARTKGASYMAIADFAQKATFADSTDATKSRSKPKNSSASYCRMLIPEMKSRKSCPAG